MISARRIAGLSTRRIASVSTRQSLGVSSIAYTQTEPNSQRTPRAPSTCRTYTATRCLRKATPVESTLGGDGAFDLSSARAPQNLTEKIAQGAAVGLPPGKTVKAGDYLTIRPSHFMSHDNSWPIAKKFLDCLGAKGKIHDPKQLVMALDHDVQNKNEANLKKYRLIEEFAQKHGIAFYPAGTGIGHQIMLEKGFVWPGTMNVASDSHSNTYSALGSLGTPLTRSDGLSVWATGTTWWCCPPVAKVTLTGILPAGVTGKDVIVALAGLFNNDEVLNHSIEFVGSEQTMQSLSIDNRISISNMTTEWGALAGIFPVDSVLVNWLRAKATNAAMFGTEAEKRRFSHEKIDELAANPMTADPGATYAKSLYLNLSTLSPFVSGPNSVKVAAPLRDLEAKKIKVDKAYLVSCTNARASDFEAAARVFREAAAKGVAPKLAPGVKLYIAAASLAEQQLMEESGDWQVLLDAGAEALPSGCGPCIGLGTGLLEPGEVGISASNRNYSGRMGSTKAEAYLASPEVVAASALSGYISGPGWYEKPEGVEKVIIGEGTGDFQADKAFSVEDALDKLLAQAEGMIAEAEKEQGVTAAAPEETEEGLTDILPGFPEKVEGEVVWCDRDSLNTDGIYPGKYTYKDDMTPEDMKRVVMENYDPAFGTTAKAGDILVSGFSFGCGSSREQAATAILAKDIRLVVAGSFGNIFSRNSINNALLGLEMPKLIKRLREKFPEKEATRRTGWHLSWDVRRSKVTVKEDDGETWTESVGSLPPSVQAIIADGGLEKWVKAEIEKAA